MAASYWIWDFFSSIFLGMSIVQDLWQLKFFLPKPFTLHSTRMLSSESISQLVSVVTGGCKDTSGKMHQRFHAGQQVNSEKICIWKDKYASVEVYPKLCVKQMCVHKSKVQELYTQPKWRCREESLKAWTQSVEHNKLLVGHKTSHQRTDNRRIWVMMSNTKW